jgi:hypothetical protein
MPPAIVRCNRLLASVLPKWLHIECDVPRSFLQRNQHPNTVLGYIGCNLRKPKLRPTRRNWFSLRRRRLSPSLNPTNADVVKTLVFSHRQPPVQGGDQSTNVLLRNIAPNVRKGRKLSAAVESWDWSFTPRPIDI